MTRQRKTIATIEVDQVGNQYAATIQLPSRLYYTGLADTITCALDMVRIELLAELDWARLTSAPKALPCFAGNGERT